MNFLLRSAQPVSVEQPSLNEFVAADANTTLSRPVTTLEGLASDDPFPRYDDAEDCIGADDGAKGLDGTIAGPSTRTDAPGVDKHSDVSEDEGWITIPCKELPEDWKNAGDTDSLRALDRNFVFPGEKVCIVASLSSYEPETEVITPFKLAAVMSRNGIGQTPKKEKENGGDGIDLVSSNGEFHQDKQNGLQNGNTPPAKGKADLQKDISASASLLRKEVQKRKTARLVQRLKSSYFFVRIADSGEMLWSKKDASKKSSDLDDQGSDTNGTSKASKDTSSNVNTIVDTGNFNANLSGGVARNNVQCCSLANGDVVVLLQINVGVDLFNDPVIEILQFEKHQSRRSTSGNHEDLYHASEDPSRGLLTWLLPVDNMVPPPVHTPSPPAAFGSPNIGSTSGRSNLSSASSASPIFSFGNLRSYSMSAIPQTSIPPSASSSSLSSKSSSNIGEWDQFSKQNQVSNEKIANGGLLSFRTVSLEPERFSVRCGLEGIYVPGRRWRRNLEIIQPIEIQSFAADCNSDDLLCVQIKNVSPAHIPDVVIYIDSITIILDEAAKGGGPPLSFPVASIEPGEDYCLPNLALRKDEEHSFILKPAIPAWKKQTTQDRSTVSSQPLTKSMSNLSVAKIAEENSNSLPADQCADQYAVVVSCHCNYSESRLFFKKPTSWRPRISRDIMISVAAEMSTKALEPNVNASQLPVQVLTLQASNLTSEDLTMTILAPASFTSPPTVVSLNSSPSSTPSPLFGLTEFQDTENQNKASSIESKPFNETDAILNNTVGCTHLWLHSRVPLGCVPSLTTATIKLEVLPLTDGIVTLDTLQIDVKEKGLTYIPEHSLKINATSSISTGIV